jgi:hypothetical protein
VIAAVLLVIRSSEVGFVVVCSECLLARAHNERGVRATEEGKGGAV